jgi:predicted RNA-binding protein YlqC (UPF0109 family)
MDNNIDQQFIEYVVKSLVGKPEAVHIDRRIDEKGVLLELTVDPEDLGRVIGKRGATAQSLRTLLRALGTKNDARYNLKIIDNDRPERPVPDNSDSASQPPPKPADDDIASDDVSDDVVAAADDTANAETEASTALTDESEETNDEAENDVVSKTRRELADLDDLDV